MLRADWGANRPLGHIYRINSDGTDQVQLTFGVTGESSPRWSPDGRSIAFLARRDSDTGTQIYLLDPLGGEARRVTAHPGSAGNITWAPDGTTIFFTALYFLANMGVHTELLHVDLESRRIRQLTSGDHTIGAWSYVRSLQQHVFTRNTAPRASDVHTLPAEGVAEPRRVTNVFDYIDRRFALARQQRLIWKGVDGHPVEGLLFYPLEYVDGQRYPLIVITHGGPEDSDKFGFHSDVQVFAAKGYAVLKPNYRGSTGYGDAFLRDMVGGYFKQSHLDVMAGVDAVIAMGLADPVRLVKMGASAGGHMTNKLITFTDRFKAASSFAGAANWISMYSQSDTRLRRDLWFGGTPYDADAPIDLYWSQSPLKAVGRVKTPTLFIVGENDPRVPLPQSVEMYRALKRHNVPTRLYVGPREGHGLGELRHRLFKFQVELEWFERYVHGRTYTWEPVPGDRKDAGEPATTQP